MQPGTQRFFVLFPLAIFLMLAGALPLAMLCFVLLAAQHWLAGEPPRAWGVVLLSGAVSGVLLGSLSVAVVLAATAASGIPIAMLLQRGWPYGRRLALVSAIVFALAGGVMALNWQALQTDMTVFINKRIAEMAENDVSNEQVVELSKWWNVNYAYLGPGSVFGSVLFTCAFLLSVLDRWQRKPEDATRRKPTGFQRMRTPDWVVWIAIAVALLWFAEQRWPNEALRAVTWNTALGLLFVYWLNGFSILLYALSVFKASAFATFMVFAGFILFGSMLPALSVLGLFDTWYDFRMRCRRFKLFRHLSYRAGNRDS